MLAARHPPAEDSRRLSKTGHRRNGAAAIRLLNPVSNNTSLQVSITPQGSGSQVQVDQNGIPLTPPWQRMIKRCAE
jgi:hypothetical protein